MIEAPDAEGTALAPRTLLELEAIVEAGLTTFVEVGRALAEIREHRLYRETHDTFETYCRERWGFNRQRASQIIQAAEVSNMLDTPPENARQAAELARLKDDPEAVREVWTEVTSAGPATAKTVRHAVDRRLGVDREDASPDAEIEPTLSSAPPTNQAEAWLLIAELAGFIQDQVMTKRVLVHGVETRHDRHCAFTAEHPVCARKCALARSLIERAELLG